MVCFVFVLISFLHIYTEWVYFMFSIFFKHNFCIKPYLARVSEGTQVIVGSMNMGYISDTARNRTHKLFHPKREPIPLGHSVSIIVHNWQCLGCNKKWLIDFFSINPFFSSYFSWRIVFCWKNHLGVWVVSKCMRGIKFLEVCYCC